MKDSLSSKDRMLMAIDHEEPDHVPLVLRPFGRKPPPHLGWRDEIERADKFLSLGIDDTISIGVPFRYHPDVSAGPGGGVHTIPRRHAVRGHTVGKRPDHDIEMAGDRELSD